MDVRTNILNCDLFKDGYMVQPVSFQQVGKGNLVCKLKKPIYGLKQASRQWYLKFEEVITRHSFKENVVDRCIYMKVSESCFIFLVLYVDDILLATNETDMLAETNQMLCNHFDMKDLGEAYFVLASRLFELGLIMYCSCLRELIMIGFLRGLICTIVLLEVYQLRRVKDFLRISVLRMIEKGWR